MVHWMGLYSATVSGGEHSGGDPRCPSVRKSVSTTISTRSSKLCRRNLSTRAAPWQARSMHGWPRSSSGAISSTAGRLPVPSVQDVSGSDGSAEAGFVGRAGASTPERIFRPAKADVVSKRLSGARPMGYRLVPVEEDLVGNMRTELVFVLFGAGRVRSADLSA